MAHTNLPPGELPESTVLTVEREGGVAVLWLDRPDKLNAMGREFWIDLPPMMAGLDADPAVRVVVIAARGKAFSVGLDLMAFGPSFLGGTLGDPGEGASEAGKRRALLAEIKAMQRTFTSIAECSKPVIAAIHGYCLGGAVDLITACDIRLAADDATFAVRETKLAMVADVGTLQRLPRIVDPGRVAELVYTGRDFPASEAHEMGLVSHVHPDRDGVLKAALDMAAQIAANSPMAVQGAKAVLRNTAGRSVEEALDYVALWNASFLHSDDLMEAVQAFVEKREPRFTGQ